jgi:hypothetical protein
MDEMSIRSSGPWAARYVTPRPHVAGMPAEARKLPTLLHDFQTSSLNQAVREL